MSEQKYDDQKIVEYLLGGLPEAEDELFDELSFTDDEFAGALKAAENDLVDAYARGELSGATLEKFKSHYLRSPARREKVNFARTFQEFAGRHVTRTGDEVPAVEEPKTGKSAGGFFSFINDFGSLNPLLSWGFGVLLLAFIASGAFWIYRNRSTPPAEGTVVSTRESPTPVGVPADPEPQTPAAVVPEKETTATNNKTGPPTPLSPPENVKKRPDNKQSDQPKQDRPVYVPKAAAVASFTLTPPVRGGGRIPALALPRQTGEVAVRLQLEADDHAEYRVFLVDQSGRRLWESGRLRAKSGGGNKVLDVRFPASLLKSQNYSLEVSGSGRGGAEIISNYPFRAVIE